MSISWQYVAGFFDGEGSIDIQSKSRYRLTLCQSQKQDYVLYVISLFLSENRIQSHIKIVVRKPGSLSIQPLSVLNIYGVRNIYTMSAAMLPYLIVKKDKIELIMGSILESVERMDKRKFS